MIFMNLCTIVRELYGKSGSKLAMRTIRINLKSLQRDNPCKIIIESYMIKYKNDYLATSFISALGAFLFTDSMPLSRPLSVL